MRRARGKKPPRGLQRLKDSHFREKTGRGKGGAPRGKTPKKGCDRGREKKTVSVELRKRKKGGRGRPKDSRLIGVHGKKKKG